MGNFKQQLKALLWRNWMLKKRKRAQLYQEIFIPVLMVAVMGSVKKGVEPDIKPSRTFLPLDVNSDQFGKRFTADTIIYVAPNTTQVSKWMEDIVSRLDGPPKYTLFESEAAAETAYKQNDTLIKFGIIFNFGGDSNSYAMRTGNGHIPSSSQKYSFFGGQCHHEGNSTSDANCQANQYLTSGFVQLQIAIDDVLMQNMGVPNTTLSSRRTYVQLMDMGEFKPDTSSLQSMSAFYFVISFCVLASYVTVSIVTEKEKKIKEAMLMMGLNPSVFWLSWTIVYMGMVAASSGIMVLIVLLTEFFEHSNLFLLFLMLLLYGASFIAMAFMITPFFNQARVAGAVAGMSTIALSLVHIGISYTRDAGMYNANIPVWSQWLLSLLSPIAFSTCMDQAIWLDLRKGGFRFDDSLTYGDFPLYAPILMMVVDVILYGILAVYFDMVIPSEYGVKYKPYFFLQPSYWCSSTRVGERQHLVNSSTFESELVDVEPVSRDMQNKVAMKISNITKSFKVDGNLIYAVNEFSLDIYEGQITCLLGHNGAGKTTLMNILTGVITPTSGKATVMGRDITVPDQMEDIRKRCGICPQHDILFENLSCKEHLRIFADIKGVPVRDRDLAIIQSLKDVGLESQGDTYSKELSGGQKRKLSVAIALIGDPKLIFLDEPTAGMDPFSRRHLWSLLKKRKEGRVVLLTTHFMDEADILSDRKAFIRRGQLRCCGSSLFLKNKFGIGYHLTTVVEPACDVDKLTSFLVSLIPGIRLERSHGKEVGYTIPLRDVSMFAEMFGKLDEYSDELGVKSYGVSMTTLEEVFLKLEGTEERNADTGNDDSQELNSHHYDNKAVEQDNGEANPAALFSENTITDEGELAKQQFKTLLWIRYLSLVRNKKSVIFRLFIPVVLTVAAMILIKTQRTDYTPPTVTDLPLTLAYYANSSIAPQLPDLLAFDSMGTAASKLLISEWEQSYVVDTYATGTENTSDVRPHFVGLQLNAMTGKYLTDFVAIYNSSAVHSIPAAVSMVTQSLIKASGKSGFINASSFPWPKKDGDGSSTPANGGDMGFAIMIGLAFVLIIPGFSYVVVQDRETRLRGQLRISGVGFNVYWGSIYAMNFVIYLIPSILIIVIALAIQLPGISSAGAIGAMLLLLICNIPFLCFFALILAFIFDKAASCNAYLPFALNMLALIPFIALSIIDMMYHNNTAIIMHYVLCLVDPPYIIMGGFYFIVRVNFMSAIAGQAADSGSYFDLDNHTLVAILMPLFHMIWMYWLLRVLDVMKTGGKVKEAFPCASKSIDVSSTPNTDTIKNEDNDVQAERQRVDSFQTNSGEEPVAYARQLRKTFEKRTGSKKGKLSCLKSLCNPGMNKTKVAVRNLSLGVNRGEVLGLLGPNGAGKTTSLNMIIAETEPTCGKVVVGGHDIRSSMMNMATLGYCPQHDALWEGITMEEHIICFATVKGVRPKEAKRLVDFYVTNMKLQDHRTKRSKAMSGGTKRKLSYIISILGNPNLVLMDEPSTGMDPQSKRFLWDTISSTFRGTSKGAILTTHYMEEADALCSRVGIMVNGELRCLGPTQHLKNKFGSGYILEVKLANAQTSRVKESMNSLEQHLQELFPHMERVERFMERAQYAIPKEDVRSLGSTFASLEDCKTTHGLEEYNFSQSSLEQVFLHFAKKQMEESHVGDTDGQMPLAERSHHVNIEDAYTNSY